MKKIQYVRFIGIRKQKLGSYFLKIKYQIRLNLIRRIE
ncbi:hypothetical protein LEP1GSC008_3102 [Leptospira kirschneri serovar Bulgarica str. Nikolaevo]|uniref:Uncharacterized protein n=1 Tax=Leptospira kirschneri serovar Bulgarica str. Nikolaevo TaxID=1240687 RepID=M6F985_9LEPT|nr:hypothetical protein LEP1GSC008_3102 [Leptospira kirschneri serovar Bulgarica str. Nikolaevo]